MRAKNGIGSVALEICVTFLTGLAGLSLMVKDVLQGCKTTRIYCREDCPPGRRIKPRNQVTFSSRQDAVAKGYCACKVCKPDDPPDGKAWSKRAS